MKRTQEWIAGVLSRSKKRERRSTLAEVVAYAKAEYDSWTPERRASVRLEGQDLNQFKRGTK